MLLVAICTPAPVGAQIERAQALETQARRAHLENTPLGSRRAAGLWKQAADLYARVGARRQAAAAWDSASSAYARVGVRDSALVYLGRALEVRDTTITTTIDSLLNASPLLQPSRSVADEALFVRQVRQLLSRVRGRPTSPDEVPSAEAAVAVLEELNSGRETWIEVHTPFPSFEFSVRRWLYRNSPSSAGWTVRTASTRFQAPRQTYQFRYRDPRTARDTVITRACADGCAFDLPAPAPPTPSNP
jgi:hypothetical protein